MEDRAGDRNLDRERQRQHYQEGVLIKLILFSAWSIALVSGGAIAGWSAHQKVAELQQNPWAIVQLIGGK